jgi:hypothetical protein
VWPKHHSQIPRLRYNTPSCQGDAAALIMDSRNNDTNFDSFRGILPGLLGAHRGKYALVHDGDLLGVFESTAEAAIYAQERFSDGLYTIYPVREMDVG